MTDDSKNKKSCPGQGNTTSNCDSQAQYSDIISSKSTATAAQCAKLIALLQHGPQTTIQLRNHGIMMPAARVFNLKQAGHVIQTELIDQYDGNGFLHARCARYRLIELAGLGASNG